MDIEGAALSGLSVLVVDDEAILRRRLAAHLDQLGMEVQGATTLEEARYHLCDRDFDFVLLDVHLPDGVGFELLREQLISTSCGVIVMTAEGGIEGAVEAMRLGALDYLPKPFDFAQIPLLMARARATMQSVRINEYERENNQDNSFFFGESLVPLKHRIEKILAADHRLVRQLPPVLITGETGSGKSTIARWIHNNGPRAAKPLIEVNCSALPDSLAESELFGSERGAFTDAHTTRQGLFEAAHGGTLFLDELPSLSPAIQAKVLTAIEDRQIRRIGATKCIEVDVRIIAATNQDLGEAVESGEFREDLLHRLDLFRLSLPALHQRGMDIICLAERMLEQLCARHRLPLRKITEQGIQNLLAYRWPGNVRELAHELERALVFEDVAALDFAHLAGDRRSIAAGGGDASLDWLNPVYDFSKETFVMEDAINRLVHLCLQLSDGNASKAARMLGVTRDFIRYRIHGKR